MGNDLAAFAKENGVKYFMISYTDLFGGQRAKLVPAQAISGMQKDGAGFAGFATWLDLTPAHPDMLAVPDPDSVIQLPWKKEVAWVAANCIMDDKEVDQTPRNTLRRLMSKDDAFIDASLSQLRPKEASAMPVNATHGVAARCARGTVRRVAHGVCFMSVAR